MFSFFIPSFFRVFIFNVFLLLKVCQVHLLVKVCSWVLVNWNASGLTMVKRIENLFLLWDATKYFLLLFFVLILPTFGEGRSIDHSLLTRDFIFLWFL